MSEHHVSKRQRELPRTMRAGVIDRYGPPDVVHLAEVPRPEPGDRDVLVRIESAAVTSGDSRLRGARFPAGFGPLVRLAFGITRPRRRILGNTFAGIVAAVGADVGNRSVGEWVCGMTGRRLGTHAEYVVVRADRAVSVPAGVSFDDATGVLFGGTTALHFLRDKASVAAGQSVLVNGASGAVGTNAVQLAKRFGATVTAVTSAANAELVLSLGADEIVDYSSHDLAAGAARFDVVIDCVGNLSIESGRRLLTDRGVLVLVVAGLWDMMRSHGRVIAGSAPERVDDIEFLLGLVASGDMTVVFDHSYDLDHLVDAYRLVDHGHKRGNVVVHPQLKSREELS